MPAKENVQFKMNVFLNSLMTFMAGIRYFGALHLYSFFLTIFLQIPACRQAGFAALLQLNKQDKYGSHKY